MWREEIEGTAVRGHRQRRALEPGSRAPIMPPTLTSHVWWRRGERQHRDVIKQTRVTSLPGSSPTWLVKSDQLGDASPWPPCRQQLINPAEGNVGVACSRLWRSSGRQTCTFSSAVCQRGARGSPCRDSSPFMFHVCSLRGAAGESGVPPARFIPPMTAT